MARYKKSGGKKTVVNSTFMPPMGRHGRKGGKRGKGRKGYRR